MTNNRRRRQMAVRADDRSRLAARQRQQLYLIGGGAGVLVLLVIAFALFGGGGGPKPTPTPTSAAVGSNRPSASASSSLPSASVGRTVQPTATSTSVAPSGPLVSPTLPAEASPLGEGIGRDVTFSLLGIDDVVAPEGIPRRITFNVDGTGEMQVDISDITAGTVRMCLYQSDGTTDPVDSDCMVTEEGKGGSLTATPTVAGPWTVWLYGDIPGRSPAATLRLRYAASVAVLNLADFRFQGMNSPNYTGFQVRLIAAEDGQLNLHATWDDGQGGDYPYLATLTDLDGAAEPPFWQGEGDQVDAVRDVVAGNHYEVRIDNTQEAVIDQVLLRATVTWP